MDNPDRDPRVVRSREAILQAAENLLTTGGIEAVNHSSVAAQARVGRATVYRHWPRQVDLLIDTFHQTKLPVFDFGEGPIVSEVTQQLIRRLSWFNQPAAGALIGALIGRAEFDGDMEELRSLLIDRSIETLVAQLEIGLSRGELVPGSSPATLAALIMGAVFFDRHMLRKELGEDDVRAIVDAALSGWLVVR